MSLAFGAATSAKVTSNVATLNIPRPGTPVSGNVLLACLVTDQSQTITNPSGFTTLLTQNASTGVRMRVCWKLATGTEGANLTFTCSTANTATAGSAILLTGNSSTPIRASLGSGSASVTSKASPALAGTQATDMVVIFGGVRPEGAAASNDVDGPSTGGWTSPATGKSGASTNPFGFPAASAVAYMINGTTGTFTCDASSGFATAAVSIIEAAPPALPDSVGILQC